MRVKIEMRLCIITMATTDMTDICGYVKTDPIGKTTYTYTFDHDYYVHFELTTEERLIDLVRQSTYTNGDLDFQLSVLRPGAFTWSGGFYVKFEYAHEDDPSNIYIQYIGGQENDTEWDPDSAKLCINFDYFMQCISFKETVVANTQLLLEHVPERAAAARDPDFMEHVPSGTIDWNKLAMNPGLQIHDDLDEGFG